MSIMSSNESDESETSKNCDSDTCDGDPGIIILYASDDNLHRMLSLGAVNNIPHLEQGTSAAESARNFQAWLDTFISNIAAGGGGGP